MPQVCSSPLNLPTSLVLPGGPQWDARGRRWQAPHSAMGKGIVLAEKYVCMGFQVSLLDLSPGPGLQGSSLGPGSGNQ